VYQQVTKTGKFLFQVLHIANEDKVKYEEAASANYILGERNPSRCQAATLRYEKQTREVSITE
jgi:hypothetical protein